jgi:hypothetical protein
VEQELKNRTDNTRAKKKTRTGQTIQWLKKDKNRTDNTRAKKRQEQDRQYKG